MSESLGYFFVYYFQFKWKILLKVEGNFGGKKVAESVLTIWPTIQSESIDSN